MKRPFPNRKRICSSGCRVKTGHCPGLHWEKELYSTDWPESATTPAFFMYRRGGSLLLPCNPFRPLSLKWGTGAMARILTPGGGSFAGRPNEGCSFCVYGRYGLRLHRVQPTTNMKSRNGLPLVIFWVTLRCCGGSCAIRDFLSGPRIVGNTDASSVVPLIRYLKELSGDAPSMQRTTTKK